MVMRRLVRGTTIGLCLIAGLPLLYVFAALLLGLLPRNSGFVESVDGIEIYVRTNGVHADLVLPTHHQRQDWSAEFPASHMRALVAATEWIAFGWGDRGFMLTTPTWSDLRPGTAFIALSGLGQGAMHVEYVDSPLAYEARRVLISAEQYGRLVAYVNSSFVRDADGACAGSMRRATLTPMPSTRRCRPTRSGTPAMNGHGALWPRPGSGLRGGPRSMSQ